MTHGGNGTHGRPWGMALGVVATAVVVALLAWVGWTYWSADRALGRREVDQIRDRGTADAAESNEPVDVLVVGSDTREGLSAEQRAELNTGSFDTERTDTILWVQLREDGVSLLSFPRDLRVEGPSGEPTKINRLTALGGPDALVGAVEGLLGEELEHYVELAIPSFLEIVEAAGGVEICLDEPLHDRKSGASFTAGCHHMDGPDALAYVRSRSGRRADFARVERQQRFLSALAERATSLSVLANPLRVRGLATSLADGLTVDEDLGVSRMVELATALREAIDGGLHTYTLPAYADASNGIAYVRPYGPGVTAVASYVRVGQPLPPRPSAETRAEIPIDIWSAGAPEEAARIESVLYFGGYEPSVGAGADGLTLPRETTVYAGDDAAEAAETVAVLLGADVRPLPSAASAGDEALVVHVGAAGRGGWPAGR